MPFFLWTKSALVSLMPTIHFMFAPNSIFTALEHEHLCSITPYTLNQGRIQIKLEGGAVSSGGAEKFSKICDKSTL